MKQLGITLIAIFCVLVLFYLLILRPETYEQKDLFEEIKSKGYIKVGINIDSKPFGFINKDDEYAGYDVDLARYIANSVFRGAIDVKFVPVTPANRMIKVSTGDVDMVIATMTITPQREEIIDFSIPYDSAGQALLVRKNSRITTMSELSGQNVGVIWGTTAEKNMLNLLPSANIIGFKSYKQAYHALKKNQITAITSDDTLLSRYALEDKEVRLLPKRYSREPYGIGFKKGESSARLREEVNHAIIDLNEKNVILRLHKKWLN